MGGSTRSTASKGASQGTAGRMSCCFPAVCREPLPKVGLLSPLHPAEHLLLLHLLSHPLQAPQCHGWVEAPSSHAPPPSELWPLPHTTALTCRTLVFQVAIIQRKAPAVGDISWERPLVCSGCSEPRSPIFLLQSQRGSAVWDSPAPRLC